MFPPGRPQPSVFRVSLIAAMASAALLAPPPGPARLSAQSAAPSSPSSVLPVGKGLEERSLRISLPGGASVERWFSVLRPARLREPAAAVVVLHGGHQSMRKIFAPSAGGTLAWLELAESQGFLLIAPNGTNAVTRDAKGDNQQWNDVRPATTSANDIAFLGQLLDWAAQTYKIDRKRIFVTGASNGGMMTFRLLMTIPERFAAGAAFTATIPVRSPNVQPPARPVPLMIANGTLDPLIRWDGGRIPGQFDRLRSTPDTVLWWVEANRAEKQPSARRTLEDRDPSDGCRIHADEYAGKAPGAPLLFYTMEGGGHTMPSIRHPLPDRKFVRTWIGTMCRDAEGAQLALDFFRRFGL